jgi:surface carbohydrate biosynthesis protein
MESESRKTKVLFSVDHKHRDLAGLSLIGYYLKYLGYSVKYVALWQEDDIIQNFDPGIIVMPKPVSNINKTIGWKKDGRKIVVVHTEGTYEYAYETKILVSPDIYFFWNSKTLMQYTSQLKDRGAIMRLSGSPRMDFLHERFSCLFPSRKDILDKLNLTDRKTITIATSAVYDTLSDDEVVKMQAQLKPLFSKPPDYLAHVRDHREIRDILRSFISESPKKFNDINIVLKPHPNEDVRVWKEFFEKLGLSNARLMTGESINQLLAISDLHVAHNLCTTIFEASLMGISSVEILPEATEEMCKLEYTGFGKYLIRNLEDLDNTVKKELYGQNGGVLPIDSSTLESHIEKFFYKADGFRCLEYALEIDKFMKKSTFKKHNAISFFSKHPNYILPYFPVLYHRYRPKVRGFIKRAIFYDKWKVKKQDADLLDGRGRYDNRMKPGDENVWFDRFEKLGLDVGALIEEYRQTVAADEIKKK